MSIRTTYDLELSKGSGRDSYGQALIELADAGEKFVFTCSDNAGASTPAGKLMQKYPERCFNFGIAESDQVGASCGLALSTGLPVFAQVFGPFLSLRAADQIHTDIAYNEVNVKLISTHSGITAAGGPTHNAIADLALYRAIPNLTVCVPADAGQCAKLIRAAMKFDGPMTIRLDRGASPNIYADEDYPFEIGKANVLFEGTDITIISCGSFLYRSMLAAKILAGKGLSVRLVDMHTIKPLDFAVVDESAKKTGAIVTVEEASLNGGLGSAVAERLAETGFGGKFSRFAFPDEFLVLGALEKVYEYYGLSPERIAERALALLGK